MEDSASQWEWTFMKENAEKPTDTTKERKVKIEKVRKETNEIFHVNQIGTATLGTIGLIESDKKNQSISNGKKGRTKRNRNAERRR